MIATAINLNERYRLLKEKYLKAALTALEPHGSNII